ncbi:MAG: Bug family tripartite tricarboxylate transporter substrate binding protein [Pseudomonadota bacterium]
MLRAKRTETGGKIMSGRLSIVRVAALSILWCGAAAAQSYPTKPIRFIIPFPAGGSADTIARTIGQKMGQDWSTQVVVENRPGAGGNIGTEAAARSAPDGYTLLMAPSSIAIAPSLYSTLGYDPIRDFAPVTLVGRLPMILVVHPSVPATSVKDLIALAKAKPGQLNYASGGNGATNHLAGELFKSIAGVEMVHVPYRGNPLAMLDVLSGQVPVMFDFMLTAMPHVRADKVRALAVTSLKRSPLFPDLPTVDEAGVPNFEASTWFGVYAPARTPPEIVAKLHGEIVTVLGSPEVKTRLIGLGLELVGSTPDQLGAETKSDVAKWGPIIHRAGIRID